jgi:alpha-tubulin suppressor-like RCC1 family protein
MNDGTIQYLAVPTDNELFLNGVTVMNISAGTQYSVFADRNGIVYGFGDYTQGESESFGIENMETCSDTPVMIGESRLLAGDNEVTVKSNGDAVKLSVPAISKFNLLQDYNDSSITTAQSMNENIATVEEIDGEFYVTGGDITGLTQIVVDRTVNNKNGEAISSEKLIYFVTNIENIETAIVAPMIASGKGHTIVLKQDGSVWAFGSNNYGQLGIGTNDSTANAVPERVTFFDDLAENGEHVIGVYAGENHSVALTDKGNVYTWGLNNRGQLGLGYNPSNRDIVTTPELVDVSGAKIVKIAVGTYHTVALGSNGVVYAWGWNEYGQLGNGSNTDKYSTTPVTVKSLNKIIEINHGSGGNTLCVTMEPSGHGVKTTRVRFL